MGRVGSTSASIAQTLVRATPAKQDKFVLLAAALAADHHASHASGGGGGAAGGAAGGGAAGRTMVFVQKKATASWVRKKLAEVAARTLRRRLARRVRLVFFFCFSSRRALQRHGLNARCGLCGVAAAWGTQLGVGAEDIHGDRNQSQREAALAHFKVRRTRDWRRRASCVLFRCQLIC